MGDEQSGEQSAQSAMWNGAAGRAWVESQGALDGMFQPFEDLLVEAIAAEGAARVLDVGCGTGGTTLALARRIGARGACTGVDISAPMIALARSRAQAETEEPSAPTFLLGDAQAYPFEPASFDAVVSRFGVMFFDAPAAAFARLRRASRPGALLHFFAWRGAGENPFMTAAERAAAPLLPGLPARAAEGPGQFAFGDDDRVRRILSEAGWSAIDVAPVDVPCALPERALDRYATQMGPVGRAMLALDEDDPLRARVTQALRAAFAPYVRGAEARFVSACWAVTARA
jgi:SAM-dependent methyltransferase